MSILLMRFPPVENEASPAAPNVRFNARARHYKLLPNGAKDNRSEMLSDQLPKGRTNRWLFTLKYTNGLRRKQVGYSHRLGNYGGNHDMSP